MQDILPWLRLQLTPGLGRAAQFQLLSHYGKPQAALDAIPAGWPSRQGIKPQLASLVPNENAPQVLAAVATIEDSKAWLCSYWDENYPQILRNIHDPPILLYGRGRWPNRDALAIVGARRPSPTGKEVTRSIARELAGAGITIVSGLARGIDTAAHRGALDVGGQTIAVLGCGIDRVYPAENRDLFHEILEEGAILSEYPPGTLPLPGHFPGRNRIISGLSRGVLVAEAALESGSLITADFALDQGREVMTIPGNITQASCAGSNQLLKQGATPVTEASDILQSLWPNLSGNPQATDTGRAASQLNEAATDILDLLDTTPRHIDTLLEQSGLTPPELSDILLHLELQEYVEQLPGMHYIRGRSAAFLPHSQREIS